MTATLNGRHIYGNHENREDTIYTFYVEFLVDRDILIELFICPATGHISGHISCATGTTDVMNLHRPPPGNPRYDYSTVTCPKVEQCINPLPAPDSYISKSEFRGFVA